MTKQVEGAELIHRLSVVNGHLSSIGFGLSKYADRWFDLLQDAERELFGLGIDAGQVILPRVLMTLDEMQEVLANMYRVKYELEGVEDLRNGDEW